MNNCVLTGRNGKAPESIASGKGVKFSIALSNDYRAQNGEWVNKPPTWLDVTYWGKNRDQLLSIEKGSELMVAGALTHEEWSTQEGQSRTKIVLKAFAVAVVPKEEANPFP